MLFCARRTEGADAIPFALSAAAAGRGVEAQESSRRQPLRLRPSACAQGERSSWLFWWFRLTRGCKYKPPFALSTAAAGRGVEASSPMPLRRFRKLVNCVPVAANPCELLRAAPPLELAFHREGFVSRFERLGMQQVEWATSGCIRIPDSRIMLLHSQIEIVRMADVEATVSAFE